MKVSSLTFIVQFEYWSRNVSSYANHGIHELLPVKCAREPTFSAVRLTIVTVSDAN